MRIDSSNPNRLFIFHNALPLRITLALLIVLLVFLLGLSSNASLSTLFSSREFLASLGFAVILVLLSQNLYLSFDTSTGVFTYKQKSLVGQNTTQFKLNIIVAVEDIEQAYFKKTWYRRSVAKMELIPYLVCSDGSRFSLAKSGYLLLDSTKFEGVGEKISNFLGVPYSVVRFKNSKLTLNGEEKLQRDVVLKQIN